MSDHPGPGDLRLRPIEHADRAWLLAVGLDPRQIGSQFSVPEAPLQLYAAPVRAVRGPRSQDIAFLVERGGRRAGYIGPNPISGNVEYFLLPWARGGIGRSLVEQYLRRVPATGRDLRFFISASNDRSRRSFLGATAALGWREDHDLWAETRSHGSLFHIHPNAVPGRSLEEPATTTAPGSRLPLGPLTTVVPGPAIPPSIEPGRSNNNLDVIDHAGSRYLAWRTAPSHFAGPDARLEVVRSDDLGRTWTHETTIALGRDIREPRFFAWADRLLLYAFEAGTDPKRFEPGRILAIERGADNRWSDPRFLSEPGSVVWRVRQLGDRVVMSVYRGAETLYTAHPEPLRVELWTTDDGYDWRPLDPDRPVLHHGGTETELLDLGDGRVAYACRKEGPDGGWGTDLGIAPITDPLDVTWRSIPEKCDSPLLARHEQAGLLLITRRQLANRGRYDLGWRRGSPLARTRAYQLRYSLSRKRTGVYRFDVDRLSLDHLGNLPSRGDTAFAAVVGADGTDPTTADRWTIYNYTSPVTGPDLPWIGGQLRPTQVVACDLDVRALGERPTNR